MQLNPRLRILWAPVDLNTKMRKTLSEENLTSRLMGITKIEC
jgi:hypothetical protein